MEGRTVPEAAQGGQPASGRRWPEAATLLVLLLLAAGVRVWLFCHTEVAARDSIGLIRIAWQLEHQPWKDVLAHSEHHPGYPALLLLVSLPLRHVLTGPDALVMQSCAQLTSVVAGTLLVVPMYYLGRELFNRTAGVWASVLFQFLPASCRVLSDGLSEATFLLFASTALYLAVRGLRGRSPALFGLCGLCSALAYLTRPEGALITAATGAVLLAAQFVPAWRRPWPNWAACAASLVLTAAVVGSPIYVATGKLSLKPSDKFLVHTTGADRTGGEGIRDENEANLPRTLRPGQPAVASLLAVWWQDSQGPKHRGHAVWGLWALGYELNKGFHYAAWLSALVGLWWFRARLRVVPGAWVLLLLCPAVALLLWRVATVMGYLSDRHTLLLLLCGSYWAAAMAGAVGLGSVTVFRSWWRRALLPVSPRVAGRGVMVALFAGLIGSALPKSFEPLHTSRGGFREVGLWLAEHSRSADPVFDPYSWTSYYAGRVFHEKEPAPAGYQPTQYVVVEYSKNGHPHLPAHEKALRLARQGQEVHRWESRHRKDASSIVIYAVPVPSRKP